MKSKLFFMTHLPNFKLNYKHQLIILLVLAVGLNINTLFNEYALDDVVVLTGNSLVQKGVKGIPKLLTSEFFYGLENKDSELSGGRYRPFALVVFALEYELFGKTPWVNHLFNVLLFTLLIALLFKLLEKHVFREQHPYLAFITCLLFVVHPIHTEVIANIKSRDELITIILLLVTAFAFINYSEKKSIGILLLGLFSYFLALLTRESAVPFIGVVPLVAYFFFNQSLKKSILLAVPLIGVFTIYFIIRTSLVGFSTHSTSDILNAPFLHATSAEAFATKVFLLFKYVSLMLFPHPLSSDYGFNQLKYIDIGSLSFILSFLFFIGLIIYAIFTFNKKSIFSFCILFFISTIFLFANFVIDIGAPLAERLLFFPSIAFCIVFATVYLKGINNYKLIANTFLITVLLLFSAKTILRNAEWKNDFTLFSADVVTVPNSIRVNLYLAHEYITKAQSESNTNYKSEYYKKAIFYDEKILEVYPHYRFIFQDLGAAYLGLHDNFKAADFYMKAYNLDPTIPEAKKKLEMLSEILYNEGNKSYKMGNTDAAIKCYNKSVELNENNVDAWYNLSRGYTVIKDTINASIALKIALKLSQKNPKI